MLRKLYGTAPGRRFATVRDFSTLTTDTPEKKLTKILKKHSGRNAQGRVTTRGQGGRSKRLYRLIDFKRDKFGVPGVVASIEYDPNRTSFVSLINYADGDKRYILAPDNLKVGDKVISDQKAPLKLGNSMPLANIAVGTMIHNIELQPGSGAKIARSAGAFAVLVTKDSGMAHLRLPSGEVRLVPEMSLATVGVLSNPDWGNIKFGKAGRKRNMGIRPTVRGVAMDPDSHPHGGGEGRSGIGMKAPKTPWGKPALGFRTRNKKKYSSRYILKRRGSK